MILCTMLESNINCNIVLNIYNMTIPFAVDAAALNFILNRSTENAIIIKSNMYFQFIFPVENRTHSKNKISKAYGKLIKLGIFIVNSKGSEGKGVRNGKFCNISCFCII